MNDMTDRHHDTDPDIMPALRYFLFMLALLAAALILTIFGGCSTTRRTVTEEIRTQTAAADTTVTTAAVSADTISVATKSDTVTADTALCASMERGALEISRDSAGRPLRLLWTIGYTGFSASRRYAATQNYIDTLRRAAAAAKAIKSAAGTKTAVKEKVTEKKKREVPVDCKIGWSLMAFVIAYTIFVVVKDYVLPWVKSGKR